MRKLKEIRFNVEVDNRLLSLDHTFQATVTGLKRVEWKLGKGPCGRWVTQLSYEMTLAGITIRQVSQGTDPEEDLRLYREWCSGAVAVDHKLHGDKRHAELHDMLAERRAGTRTEVFEYKLEDIKGRIYGVEI